MHVYCIYDILKLTPFLGRQWYEGQVCLKMHFNYTGGSVMNIKKLLILVLVSAISISSYAAPRAGSNGAINSNDGGRTNSEQKSGNSNNQHNGNQHSASSSQVANYQSALSALVTSLVQNNPSLAADILSSAMSADPSMAALISDAAAQGVVAAVAAGIPGAAAAQTALTSFNTHNADKIADTQANISPNISAANAANALTSNLNSIGAATAAAATGGTPAAYSENPATTNIGQQMVTNVQAAVQSGQITQAQANQLDAIIHTVNPSISISPNQ